MRIDDTNRISKEKNSFVPDPIEKIRLEILELNDLREKIDPDSNQKFNDKMAKLQRDISDYESYYAVPEDVKDALKNVVSQLDNIHYYTEQINETNKTLLGGGLAETDREAYVKARDSYINKVSAFNEALPIDEAKIGIVPN